MGQKVNPHGLRVGIISDWDSKWYASGQEFADNLAEDYNIRKFLKKEAIILNARTAHTLFAQTVNAIILNAMNAGMFQML